MRRTSIIMIKQNKNGNSNTVIVGQPTRQGSSKGSFKCSLTASVRLENLRAMLSYEFLWFGHNPLNVQQQQQQQHSTEFMLHSLITLSIPFFGACEEADFREENNRHDGR
jgi:hypothetical protein